MDDLYAHLGKVAKERVEKHYRITNILNEATDPLYSWKYIYGDKIANSKLQAKKYKESI